MEAKILTYRDDPRVKEYHFILSDINSYFLKKYGLNCTVDEFKDKVRRKYKWQAIYS